MAARDVVLALLDLLQQDADVAALVTGLVDGLPVVRVHGEELPGTEVPEQPRRAVVVRRVPGPDPIGGYVELQREGLEVWCFGATPEDAAALSAAVQPVLKQARRQLRGGTLLHSVTQVGSPRYLRDPDTGWPAMVTPWTALAAEVQAT